MNNFKSNRVFSMVAVATVGLVVILYALTRFQGFLEGPSIAITSPPNGSVVANSFLSIEGVAKQVAFITLSDRQIFVDEEGRLAEELLLFPGYNIISLKATDRFGRRVERRLELIYKE